MSAIMGEPIQSSHDHHSGRKAELRSISTMVGNTKQNIISLLNNFQYEENGVRAWESI